MSAALWGRGFRPFFLGAGVYAAVFVAAWTVIWRGALPAPVWLIPAWWHGHEMVFGVAAAAVAGFLLTASPVWTGRTPVTGGPLAALFALWALGRVAMLAAGALPAAVVAAADLAFLPALGAALLRTLWGTGQRHNYGVVAMPLVLAAANAAVHAEALGLATGAAQRALRLAVDGVVVLIVVIGGRITPSFTGNALRQRGVDAPLRSFPWVDRLAVAGTVATAAIGLVAPRSAASGAAAGLAGLAVAARLAGWQTRHTLGDPLLWSLHAGMAWSAAGLLLVAAGDLAGLVPMTTGLHALGAGAMGAMILAVVTRVGLGHTGRPLVLPRGAVLCYALVHAGAAARVASTVAPAAWQPPLLVAGGSLWAAAFALFAVLYAPILTRPRVDGAPG